ncbi:hypothetical protein [Prevotella bivia]|uniref:hypothetical protein n=1 Tax=Prevotella bivia TaxID=28125 RepID=UPI000A58F554|nr:hypothetical protein [Prevotella bivia]
MTNTRSLNYGFRWQFLLFPFLPTLLMCKYIGPYGVGVSPPPVVSDNNALSRRW